MDGSFFDVVTKFWEFGANDTRVDVAYHVEPYSNDFRMLITGETRPGGQHTILSVYRTVSMTVAALTPTTLQLNLKGTGSILPTWLGFHLIEQLLKARSFYSHFPYELYWNKGAEGVVIHGTIYMIDRNTGERIRPLYEVDADMDIRLHSIARHKQQKI